MIGKIQYYIIMIFAVLVLYNTFAFAAKLWFCDASCNVQAIAGREPSTFPDRVTGNGRGTNEAQACANAKRDATQKSPLGTYARHCQCSCRR